MSTARHLGPASRIDPRVLWALVIAKLAVHLAVLGRYGIHVDELYFLACGGHLDFGYVDHGPLVPWIARLSTELLSDSAAALRIAPALAGAAVVFLTVTLAATLGGGSWAQLVAGLSVLVAPVYLRAQSLLSLPALEPLFWTLASLLALRAVRAEDESRAARWWLATGLVAGVGLLNKHTMAVWGLGVALGLALSPDRSVLRRPWPWLGAAVSFVVFLPNLWWQVRHDWATLEFLQNIRHTMLAEIPRPLFLLGQVVYQHPLTIPLWLAGLYLLFTARGPDHRSSPRFLGWAFVVAFGFFLVLQSKPYYLAPAYPPLLAAGSVWLEGRLHDWGRRLLPVLLLVTGVVTAAAALPVFPLSQVEQAIGAVLGPLLRRPADLTGEFRDQFGWRELAATVEGHVEAVSRRPEVDPESVVVLTRKYSQASAIGHFSEIERPILSGHMTYWLWGPGQATDESVLAVGFEPAEIESWCPAPEELGRFSHPLQSAEDHDLPTLFCRGSGRFLREIWPRLRSYDHVARSASPSSVRPRGGEEASPGER